MWKMVSEQFLLLNPHFHKRWRKPNREWMDCSWQKLTVFNPFYSLATLLCFQTVILHPEAVLHNKLSGCNLCIYLVTMRDFWPTVVVNNSACVPETLDVWSDPWQPVDPVNNPMLLNKLCTSLQNLRNWGQERRWWYISHLNTRYRENTLHTLNAHISMALMILWIKLGGKRVKVNFSAWAVALQITLT